MDDLYERRRFINYGHVCVMSLSVSHQTVHVTCTRDNDLLKLFLDTGWHPCKKKKEMMHRKSLSVKQKD